MYLRLPSWCRRAALVARTRLRSDVSGSCRGQPIAETSLRHRRHVEMFRAHEALHPFHPARESLRKGVVCGEYLVLEPQPEDRERRGRSLHAADEPCDQAVAPQDGKRVVAELALRGGRVDLPDVVEEAERRRASADADGG